MNSDIYLYVTSIIDRGNYNSAIFSGYKVDEDGNIVNPRKARVKATGKALNYKPVYVGQTWKIIESVEENYVQDINGFKKNISQIKAISLKLHSKAGDNFIAFISGNENFKGIGLTKARKLWLAFGENIYSLLSSCDVDELKKVVSKQAAINMIEVWKTEGCYSSLIWLDENNIPSDIGIKVVDYYKNQTKEKIKEDPYRFIAFCASWKSVDSLALHTFNIEMDDVRRLYGAIEDALYSSYSTKNTALSSVDLKQKIKARLLPKDTDGNVLDAVDNQKDALRLANLALENIEGN